MTTSNKRRADSAIIRMTCVTDIPVVDLVRFSIGCPVGRTDDAAPSRSIRLPAHAEARVGKSGTVETFDGSISSCRSVVAPADAGHMELDGPTRRVAVADS